MFQCWSTNIENSREDGFNWDAASRAHQEAMAICSFFGLHEHFIYKVCGGTVK